MVSGWKACPSCEFLVAADEENCRYCGGAVTAARAAAPASLGAPAPLSAPGPLAAPTSGAVSTLPPPPPVPATPRPAAFGPGPTALPRQALPPPPSVPPAGRPAGASFPPPFPASPQGGTSRKSVRAIVFVAVAALVCVVVGYGVFAISRASDQQYPDAWDPRIEPLARFVEQERGAPFLHPVYVDFIDSSAFDESVTAFTEPSDEERAEADRYAGLYRAMGLASGDLDLLAGSDQVATQGVAAYYSADTKRITIDGLELDPLLRSTVVHELVHAWQDQILDFLEIEGRIDPAAYDAYRAAVEGDAMRVEAIYYESQLTDAERAEYDEAAAAQVDSAGDVVGDEPPRVLVAEFSAWYSLGEPYVGILEALRGTTAIEDAIRNPTASSKVLIDPFARVEGHEPEPVPEPPLEDGEKRFDGGSFGALFLYLVLNERVGSKEALASVDTWAGDAYVAFTRDEQVCVRAELRAESPEGLARLSGAVSAWAGAMPAGSVTVTTDQVIGIHACDAGADAAIPPPVEADVDPLLVPAIRMYLTYGMLTETRNTRFVSCAVDSILTNAPLEAMTSTSESSLDPYMEGAGQGCAHLL